MPEHLVVIRSGATDYELQRRIRGNLDVPLCDAGIAAARRAAARLAAAPPAALYASPTACAFETARLVGAACGLRPLRLPALRNLDLGLWQGRLVEEIRVTQPRLHRQWQDNPWSVAPPEGELLEQACERVEKELERIRRRHPAGRVAVVVPAPLASLVTWIAAGVALGDLWSCDPQADLVQELPLAAQWRSGSQSGAAAAAGAG